MTKLDARLARGPLRVQSVWSPGSPERVARRILERRRFWFGLDAVAVCACIALALGLSARRPLRPSSGVVASGAEVAGRVNAFADGSVAESSSRDTQLVVEQDTPTQVVARLTGGARFQVVHNPARTFEVRAGDVRVRVLGTVFSVEQLPSGVTQVLVEQGHVEVAWLGGATFLESGQGGTFPPAVVSEAEPKPPSTASVPADPAPGVRGVARERASAGAGWREAARSGDYGRAYVELNAKGQDAVRDEAGDLMLAADVARLSAHPADALRPLRSVCERHAGDRRAPVAAFTLGRVLIDDLGRPGEAASAFQRARALWPDGPLAEDALAREADAWQHAARPDAARTAARDYLERYSQGRHNAAMRKILGE